MPGKVFQTMFKIAAKYTGRGEVAAFNRDIV